MVLVARAHFRPLLHPRARAHFLVSARCVFHYLWSGYFLCLTGRGALRFLFFFFSVRVTLGLFHCTARDCHSQCSWTCKERWKGRGGATRSSFRFRKFNDVGVVAPCQVILPMLDRQQPATQEATRNRSLTHAADSELSQAVRG